MDNNLFVDKIVSLDKVKHIVADVRKVTTGNKKKKEKRFFVPQELLDAIGAEIGSHLSVEFFPDISKLVADKEYRERAVIVIKKVV